MSEGEFKKRLCDEAFKTTWQGRFMTRSLDSILLDEALKLIEEARKEFPLSLPPKGYRTGDMLELWDWFVKWFGSD